MCLQAVPTSSPALSLQTIDRVKNYKVVGQVSNYARDLAEQSTIYNYLAPMSHKGLAKVSPYVPDVSQYVPKKYVAKVDSLGVTCLERFENVTITSEEVLQRKMKGVTQYVHNLLPAEEPATKDDETEAVEDGTSFTFTGLPRRVYAGVSTKATSIINPVSTKVTGVRTKVTTKVTGAFNDALGTVTSTLAPIKAGYTNVNNKVREGLSFEKFSEVAVASTSYGVSKAGAALQVTKSTTLAYVPKKYRDSVEETVTKYEEHAIALYQRLPTQEEVRNVDREQAKAILGKAVNIGTAPLWSLISKVKAPFTGAVPSTPKDEGTATFTTDKSTTNTSTETDATELD